MGILTCLKSFQQFGNWLWILYARETWRALSIDSIMEMKMSERSRTSNVGHFLVLLPQNLLCDVMVRCHTVISHHRPCHSDGLRSNGLGGRVLTDRQADTHTRLRFYDLDRYDLDLPRQRSRSWWWLLEVPLADQAAWDLTDKSGCFLRWCPSSCNL